MWEGLPIVIFGTSGHAQEIACIINDINKKNYINQFNFLGFVSEEEEEIGKTIGEKTIIVSDKNFEEFTQRFKVLGIILPMTSAKIKSRVYNKVKLLKNVVFPNILSPHAVIGDLSQINMGIGNIIAGGSTITCNITLGDFNLINRNVGLGHDTTICDYCTVNPSASISGNCKLKSNVTIGAGAAVLQGVTIGKNSIVGLGGFVVKDVPENTTVICKPAEPKII